MEHSLLLKSHSDERARELLQERYSLTGTQKPFLVLHEGVNDAKPTGVASKRKSKRSTRKSQASDALERFREKGDPQYTKYLPLNKQWDAYIANVGNSGDALLSADWHGAYLRVKTAKNPSYVGLKGILLWESRTQWLVVCEDNKFRVIPKRGTIVLCGNEKVEFAVVGDRVLCRSTERTTRKFKPHDVSELVQLLQ